MPKGPKGDQHPADPIGAAVKLMRVSTADKKTGYRRTAVRTRLLLQQRSPAMAFDLAAKLWSVEDLLALIDAVVEARKKPTPIIYGKISTLLAYKLYMRLVLPSVIIAIGLIIGGFFIGGRYSALPSSTNAITRVDRLTGAVSMCIPGSAGSGCDFKLDRSSK